MARYGFIDRKTGLLARLEHNPHGSCYGSSYTLSREEHLPVFTVSSPEKLGAVLFEDVSGYNSAEDRPSWGPFKRGDLQPVLVEVEVRTTPVDAEPPPDVDVLDSRDIPAAVARRHLGNPDLPPGRYVFSPVRPTDALPRDRLAALVGRSVCIGSLYNRRTLAGVADLPEEFRPVYAEDVFLAVFREEECPPYVPPDPDDGPLVLAGLGV